MLDYFGGPSFKNCRVLLEYRSDDFRHASIFNIFHLKLRKTINYGYGYMDLAHENTYCLRYKLLLYNSETGPNWRRKTFAENRLEWILHWSQIVIGEKHKKHIVLYYWD